MYKLYIYIYIYCCRVWRMPRSLAPRMNVLTARFEIRRQRGHPGVALPPVVSHSANP